MSLRYFDNIQYGPFKDLEVLVDPDDKSLWIPNPTLERFMGWECDTGRKKLTSKTLKSFAGKPLRVGKLVKAYDVKGQLNNIKAIPFETFQMVVFWEFKQGNENAEKLIVAGFTDSFTSMVLEQCGVKLTIAERQNVVSFYLTRYHEFQDWVRDTYLEIHGQKPDSEYYRRLAVTINKSLFGVSHFNCDRLKNAENEDLRLLEDFQRRVVRHKQKFFNVDPMEVVQVQLGQF